MHRHVIILIGLLLCTSYTGAQEVSVFTVPLAFELQWGKRLYYMPNNQLEVRGYDFSEKRSWYSTNYVSYVSRWFNATYTHSPSGVYAAPSGALLDMQSHRGDVEIKAGLPVNPTITAEWSAWDLHSWKWAEVEVPSQYVGMPNKQMAWTYNRESIQRLYGGVGFSYERSLAPNISVKNSIAWRFINQDGWEATSTISWTPRGLIKGDPYIMVGTVGHESYYDWGKSRNFGFVAEIGLTF